MSAEKRPPVVLITGATDGLGKAAALYLAGRGYRVFAAGRSPEKRAQLDAVARQKKLAIKSISWMFVTTRPCKKPSARCWQAPVRSTC